MSSFLENTIALLWNMMHPQESGPVIHDGLHIGWIVGEQGVTRTPFFIPDWIRREHIATFGTTGSGKTTLFEISAEQDIRERRGFFYFEPHGESTPHLLSLIAAEEQRTGQDLSGRLIVIDPSDRYAIGLNFLEALPHQDTFVQIAENAAIFKKFWADTSGARTEELLRNTLYSLAACRLTYVEIRPFLKDSNFRAACLRHVNNAEILAYFESGYDQASRGMQESLSAPILNRMSAFTVDPRFRAIVGQQTSTINFVEAMDRGYWIIASLPKGRLGEQSGLAGSLLLTKLKAAVFARQRRSLFTFYVDELPTVVAYDAGLQILLSEARKFGVGLFTGAQFLQQFSAEVQAALQSISSHIYFHLSATDAEKVSSALDGGKAVAQLLKNLPHREMVIKSGPGAWQRVKAKHWRAPDADFSDLLARSRRRWCRTREDVEAEIRRRQQSIAPNGDAEDLHGWE